MYRFGSHVSCAGGLLRAVDRATEIGCQCLQIFVSPPRAWPTVRKLIPLEASPIAKRSADSSLNKQTKPEQQAPTEDPSRFRKAVAAAGLEAPISHACYLINLASPDTQLWERSVEALSVEWQRSDELKLDGIVMHPGAHTTTSIESGLENIVRGIQLVQKRIRPQHCPLLLENTAGQGTCLGWNCEQLGWLIGQLSSQMVKVCWDTCHALAAGYDFRTEAGMQSMIAELHQHGVLNEIRAVHINDSVKECGSRVDRHEHIGQGCIGSRGFKLFLKSHEFNRLPMYLETEKGVDDKGQDWDVRNLKTLRSYAAR